MTATDVSQYFVIFQKILKLFVLYFHFTLYFSLRWHKSVPALPMMLVDQTNAVLLSSVHISLCIMWSWWYGLTCSEVQHELII